MKAVILAGGYAKRMWPYTLDKSKPLLEVAGRPVIGRILDRLAPLGPEKIYVSTNQRFAGDFERWAGKAGKLRERIEVVAENSLSENQKLGSIGALKYLIDSRKISDDLLVVAGDNLFDFDLSGIVTPGSISVGLFDIGDREGARRFGVVEVDRGRKITGFEEKPESPKTTIISTCIYYLPKKYLNLISEYLKEKNNPDSPGYFISWLFRKQDVYGFVFTGKWFDIGSMEAYEKARKEFGAQP